MPLYTYVVSYNGESYVTQARRSNPKGFPDWVDALPPEIRGGLNPYDGAFDAIPNRENLWRKTLAVGGSDLVVLVIQTDDK